MTSLGDVRSLGASAPIRAAYELSKHVGGHRVLFNALRHRMRPEVLPTTRTAPVIPREVKQRTLQAADEIAKGHVVLFGRTIPSGADRWHDVIELPMTWPVAPWWTIDIRTERRPGDVKWVWELGRQRHLVVLARAAALAPERRYFESALISGLSGFIEQNPPETGIQWYSNLEIALRVVAWWEILSLVSLPAALGAQLGGLIRHSGWHLLADLPYTVSTMRNNHLLGDSLGLMAVASLLPPHDRGGRVFGSMGRSLFRWQLARQFSLDGTTIEDSLSYHRFVMEMVAAHRHMTGLRGDSAMPGSHSSPMLDAGRFLSRLGALEGPVPQFGDWDEGRVLTSVQDPEDTAGSARLALALAGTGAPREWRQAYDECAWYAPEGEPATADAPVRDGRSCGGGIARAEAGDLTVWLKAGGASSHTHADRSSIAVSAGGQWLIGDPGTGTYNGDLRQRNYFRASVAHSVLRLAGEDQLGPRSAFRWQYEAKGVIGPPLRIDDERLIMWGAHDAYRRLNPSRRVVRAVVLVPYGLVVVDWVEGPPGIPYDLSIPLGPDCSVGSKQVITDGRGKRWLFMASRSRVQTVTGSTDPFDGWWSPTYGAMTPATRLSMTGVLDGPVCWSLAAGHEVRMIREGSRVIVAGVGLTLTWKPSGATLSVSAGGIEAERSLQLALHPQ